MIKKLINKLLLGNTQIAGMRTILLNTITLILAMWEFASKDGGLFAFLCDVASTVPALAWFCTISATSFYASALVVITALNNVLRWLTDMPVGLNTKAYTSANVIFEPRPSAAKEAIIVSAVALSIIAIILVIIL